VVAGEVREISSAPRHQNGESPISGGWLRSRASSPRPRPRETLAVLARRAASIAALARAVGLVGDVVDGGRSSSRCPSSRRRSARPPLRLRSPLAACTAMPSVTLAFSPFCVIEAVICSTTRSSPRRSRLLAGGLVHRLRRRAHSSEADDSDSALARTSPTTCASFAVMSRMDATLAYLVLRGALDAHGQIAVASCASVTLTACESGTVSSA